MEKRNWKQTKNVIKTGGLKQVKTIFENGIYQTQHKCLLAAAQNQSIDVMIYLIFELKCRPNEYIMVRVLQRAGFKGNLPIIKLLIEFGVDWNERDRLNGDIIEILKRGTKYSLIPQVEDVIRNTRIIKDKNVYSNLRYRK